MHSASGLLSYTPSLAELSIIVGAFALNMFLYTLAEKVFDLEIRHSHVAQPTMMPKAVEVDELVTQ